MNPAKYLRWSFWEKFLQNAPPIFGKHSILVVRQGSKDASVLLCLSCCKNVIDSEMQLH